MARCVPLCPCLVAAEEAFAVDVVMSVGRAIRRRSSPSGVKGPTATMTAVTAALAQEKSVCREVRFRARAILGRGPFCGFGAVGLARVGKAERAVKERNWTVKPRSGEGVPGRATGLAAGVAVGSHMESVNKRQPT